MPSPRRARDRNLQLLAECRQRAIALLKAEIDRDLALLGIRKLREITPDLVRKF